MNETNEKQQEEVKFEIPNIGQSPFPLPESKVFFY